MSAEARRSAAVRDQLAAVSQATATYEGRWTLHTLKRVDPDLHKRLDEQRDIFDRTLFHAETAEEIIRQGEAMCRGWQAAARVMEASGEADDAYFIGADSRTGVKVAVGPSRAGVGRVSELHGDTVTWLTPDEVATLYAATEGFKSIDAIKRLMPGAEIVDRRPMDPAKRDSGVEASPHGAAA